MLVGVVFGLCGEWVVRPLLAVAVAVAVVGAVEGDITIGIGAPAPTGAGIRLAPDSRASLFDTNGSLTIFMLILAVKP